MAADKKEKQLSPSELRKLNKPLMEKKRRERINTTLGKLKGLVLEALNRDSSRYSKLEKADILEMTVKHLQNVQRQQMAVAMANDSTVINKYRSGFNECASEVQRYLGSIEGLDHSVKGRLLGHLNDCMAKVNGMGGMGAASMTPSQGYPGALQIPSATPLSAVPGASYPAPAPTAVHAIPQEQVHIQALQAQTLQAQTLQMMPTTLPNGQLVFIPSYSAAVPAMPTPASEVSTPVPFHRTPSPQSSRTPSPEMNNNSYTYTNQNMPSQAPFDNNNCATTVNRNYLNQLQISVSPVPRIQTSQSSTGHSHSPILEIKMSSSPVPYHRPAPAVSEPRDLSLPKPAPVKVEPRAPVLPVKPEVVRADPMWRPW